MVRPLQAAQPRPHPLKKLHLAAVMSGSLPRMENTKWVRAAAPLALRNLQFSPFFHLLSLIVGTSNGMMKEDEFRLTPPTTENVQKPACKLQKQRERGKWVFGCEQ